MATWHNEPPRYAIEDDSLAIPEAGPAEDLERRYEKMQMHVIARRLRHWANERLTVPMTEACRQILLRTADQIDPGEDVMEASHGEPMKI